LLHYPETQNKLRKEINKTIGTVLTVLTVAMFAIIRKVLEMYKMTFNISRLKSAVTN